MNSDHSTKNTGHLSEFIRLPNEVLFKFSIISHRKTIPPSTVIEEGSDAAHCSPHIPYHIKPFADIKIVSNALAKAIPYYSLFY